MKNSFPKYNNYDKHPVIEVLDSKDQAWEGWDSVATVIQQRTENLKPHKKVIICVECYTGVDTNELIAQLLQKLKIVNVFLADEVFKSENEIHKLVAPDVTDDRVFGYLSRLNIQDFIDAKKLDLLKQKIESINEGTVIIIGTGAHKIHQGNLLVYADMPRWEGQLRYRRNEAANLGSSNFTENAAAQYKRAYFVDWRVCDRIKKIVFPSADFIIDTVIPNQPKMATGNAVLKGLNHAVNRPIRLVPFFDPGPWGGQWMKEVCDLDKNEINFAWCFDCVPEENSLLLSINGIQLELPSQNLVYFQSKALLGDDVYALFGDEFPIRFDFLDTIGGGNLSLQVHPLTQYIQEHFGMHYTQDESYYILDAGKGANVYLGLKEGINSSEMIDELKQSETTGKFDADKYVEQWPAKKHDHFLIPAGTVHCSGNESMVLEISATPYIFTFKLWDWGRMGLDGKPRPINVNRGVDNIQWDRDTKWTKENLINNVQKLSEGDGWAEERTGLHHTQFIETRRHWFTKTVTHHTNNLVNVLNLIEGAEAIIESPTQAFDPYIVHYAETFIIPANVGAYTIRPYGQGVNKLCGTIKAFVKA